MDTDRSLRAVRIAMNAVPDTNGRLSSLVDLAYRAALTLHAGDIKAAAAYLGVSRDAIYKRLSRWGVNPEQARQHFRPV